MCMYGNGKDYLFTNVVKRFASKQHSYQLKVLNTVSSDELRDFADMLESEDEPTICLVNLRIRKDVSWFIRTLDELRIKRGYAFVSFICCYVGDIYQALMATEAPVTHSLSILKRVPYEDALHIIAELSDRFEFYPSEEQKQDIFHWSYGHVGLLRTLYLLKRQTPDAPFTTTGLLREPTVIERLNNILREIPTEHMAAVLWGKLSFIEKTFLEEFGFIDSDGKLFHPLLTRLIPGKQAARDSTLSLTELRVLEYLKLHQDTLVSRADIARIVWGEEEWEDKYSDWAIGQLIYRLRKKLEYSASTASIQTRKGQGFVYAI